MLESKDFLFAVCTIRSCARASIAPVGLRAAQELNRGLVSVERNAWRAIARGCRTRRHDRRIAHQTEGIVVTIVAAVIVQVEPDRHLGIQPYGVGHRLNDEVGLFAHRGAERTGTEWCDWRVCKWSWIIAHGHAGFGQPQLDVG